MSMEKKKQGTTTQRNPPPKTPKKKQKNNNDPHLLFFIPLLTDAKNDPFVKFHVKQGLLVFILAVISMIISWVPVIFWISWLLNLAVLVFFILGVINAATGKEKELPLIGHLAEKFNF